MSEQVKFKRGGVVKLEHVQEFWSRYGVSMGLRADKVANVQGGRCAACGASESLERAHIVPHMFGGSGREPNLMPLCKACHAASPDVVDSTAVLHWVNACTAQGETGRGFTVLHRCELVPDWECDAELLTQVFKAGLSGQGSHRSGISASTLDWQMQKALVRLGAVKVQ